MFYGVELSSRLLLGTARYPSPKLLVEAIKVSGAEVVTVSLRREAGPESSGARGGQIPDTRPSSGEPPRQRGGVAAGRIQHLLPCVGMQLRGPGGRGTVARGAG